MKPYTLRETLILWASQYDWEVLKKIKSATEIGIVLGITLDLVVWFYIKL